MKTMKNDIIMLCHEMSGQGVLGFMPHVLYLKIYVTIVSLHLRQQSGKRNVCVMCPWIISS